MHFNIVAFQNRNLLQNWALCHIVEHGKKRENDSAYDAGVCIMRRLQRLFFSTLVASLWFWFLPTWLSQKKGDRYISGTQALHFLRTVMRQSWSFVYILVQTEARLTLDSAACCQLVNTLKKKRYEMNISFRLLHVLDNLSITEGWIKRWTNRGIWVGSHTSMKLQKSRLPTIPIDIWELNTIKLQNLICHS